MVAYLCVLMNDMVLFIYLFILQNKVFTIILKGGWNTHIRDILKFASTLQSFWLYKVHNFIRSTPRGKDRVRDWTSSTKQTHMHSIPHARFFSCHKSQPMMCYNCQVKCQLQEVIYTQRGYRVSECTWAEPTQSYPSNHASGGKWACAIK